jgi:hypothetical protein
MRIEYSKRTEPYDFGAARLALHLATAPAEHFRSLAKDRQDHRSTAPGYLHRAGQRFIAAQTEHGSIAAE